MEQTKDKIDRLKDYTISGAPQDFASYQRLVGRYEILVEQYEELRELQARFTES